MIEKMWTEKYRPKTIADYVFVDDRQRQIVTRWIEEQSIPNVLFSGEPGTGKTSLARVLINELGVNDYDVLEINASRENGVDVVRNKISTFAETMPFGRFKVVLLDEADYCSPAMQAALRNDMEAYADTVRFILTCNYEHKIIPALRESRCTKLYLAKPNMEEFMVRAATVLVSEGIACELDVLDAYATAAYPDLRKLLNLLQTNSINGVLNPPTTTGNDENELLAEAAVLFGSGNVAEARSRVMQLISMSPTRVEDIYRWLYTNLGMWGFTSDTQRDMAIIAIRDGLANLPMVAIPEISVAATMAELAAIQRHA